MQISLNSISTWKIKRRIKIPNSTPEPEIQAIPIKIRQYKAADKESVHAINQVSLEISFNYYYDLFHEREPELFLIAERENEIVGFILVKTGTHFDTSSSALIYAIAVSPLHRSSGIGTRLVNAICNKLEVKQIKKFFLHVRVENTRAIQFYERLGFSKIKKIKQFYSWGDDAFRMLKYID